MNVAVLGLGLIGGSLARDLAARGATVIGHDSSARTMRAAKRAGVISGSFEADFAQLESCELVVIAVPVHEAPLLLAKAAPFLSKTPCITDVGSTKLTIVRAAVDLGLDRQFVGGHPFSGDHAAGWGASRLGLFAGARVFLCPTDRTRRRALVAARKLWKSVGARPEHMNAGQHDSFVARASHLPHLASAALGIMLRASGITRAALGPGGRDATRLAGSDPNVWAAISVDNGKRLATLIAQHRRQLEQVEHMISCGDRIGLERWICRANTWFSESA